MSPCPRNIAPPSAKHRSIKTFSCQHTTRWCREKVTCTPCTPIFSISSVKTPGSDSKQTKDSSEEAEAAQWQRRDRMQLTLPIVVHDSPWPAISAGVHTCNCDVIATCNSKGNLPTETGRRTPALKSDSRVSPPIDLKQFCSTGRRLRHQIVYLLTTLAQVGLTVPRQGDRAFCRGPICLKRESGCSQFYSSFVLFCRAC